MPQSLVYVDESAVRPGKLDELRAAIAELAEFIEANEPDLIAYNAYLSGDGTRMTVIHIHTDPGSLEYHMEVAGPRFRKFADLVELRSIRVYGTPSESAIEQLNEKAELLGADEVVVRGRLAGFSRLGLKAPTGIEPV